MRASAGWCLDVPLNEQYTKLYYYNSSESPIDTAADRDNYIVISINLIT